MEKFSKHIAEILDKNKERKVKSIRPTIMAISYSYDRVLEETEILKNQAMAGQEQERRDLDAAKREAAIFRNIAERYLPTPREATGYCNNCYAEVKVTIPEKT